MLWKIRVQPWLLMALLVSCQRGEQPVKISAESVLYWMEEDIDFYELETQMIVIELRHDFAPEEASEAGKNLFALFDAISVLTDQLLGHIHSKEEANEVDFETLYSVYSQYLNQVLKEVGSYLRKMSKQLGIKDDEIEQRLSWLNQELALKHRFESSDDIVTLKMMEWQVVKIKYKLFRQIGSMYSCFRISFPPMVTPYVANFGELGPILQNKETLVNIGIQSEELYWTYRPRKLIILGDTLEYEDQQHHWEYALPTDKKGRNKLLVKLEYENILTGQLYGAAVDFEYMVQEK